MGYIHAKMNSVCPYDVFQSLWGHACSNVPVHVADTSFRITKQNFDATILRCHIWLFSCRKLGWDSIPGEDHFSALLRAEILQALVIFGHDQTQKEALDRFQTLLNDRNTPLLSADTKGVIKSLYVYYILILIVASSKIICRSSKPCPAGCIHCRDEEC